MRKIPEFITEEELISIIKKTKKEHHKLAFLLGFYQCMRISEIVKLMQIDIDKNSKIIKVHGSMSGGGAKGDKDRNIPIAPEIIRGIKNLPIGCGVRSLQRAFKIAARKAGIVKKLHFHSLRHSGATYYLNIKGWDIRLVQQFLGHARLDTTQIYTHVTPKNLIDKMWGVKKGGF